MSLILLWLSIKVSMLLLLLLFQSKTLVYFLFSSLAPYISSYQKTAWMNRRLLLAPLAALGIGMPSIFLAFARWADIRTFLSSYYWILSISFNFTKRERRALLLTSHFPSIAIDKLPLKNKFSIFLLNSFVFSIALL